VAKVKKVKDVSEVIKSLAIYPVSYVKTGVVSFDMLFGGRGLPLSYMVELTGNPSFGKSTVLLSVAKSLADRGYKTLFNFTEKSDQLASDMGIGPEYEGKVDFMATYTYTEMDAALDAFIESDYVLMVVDSLTGISSTKVFDSEVGLEDYVIASDAIPRTRLIKKAAGKISRVDKCIVWVCQKRSDFGASSWNNQDPTKSDGGKALAFFAQVRCEVRGDRRVESLVDAGGGVIGKQGYLVCPEKNRTAKPGVKVPVMVVFGRGASNVFPLLFYCLWRGYITGSGWYECRLGVDGAVEKVQGKPGRNRWVTEHSVELLADLESHSGEFYEALWGGLYDDLSGQLVG